MGLRVLYDDESEHACFYNSVTMHTLKPVFYRSSGAEANGWGVSATEMAEYFNIWMTLMYGSTWYLRLTDKHILGDYDLWMKRPFPKTCSMCLSEASPEEMTVSEKYWFPKYPTKGYKCTFCKLEEGEDEMEDDDIEF